MRAMGATQGPLSGTTIGDRYRVQDAIGRQLVGTVYEARRDSSEDVFLVTHLEILSPSEFPAAEALARGLIDDSTTPGSGVVEWLTSELPGGPAAFLVEERPAGIPIAKLVAEGTRLDELQARDVARSVLDRVSTLHGASPPIIHGDVSPHCLWRADAAKSGSLRLSSFASACARAGKHGSTPTADANAFSPPELRSGPPTVATDVFGVGATIAFLLTGRPPGALPRKGREVDLRAAVPVSPSLAAWVARALADDPRRRFANASEARWALDVPMQAAGAGGPRLGVLAAGVGVGLLLIGVVVGGLWLRQTEGVPFMPHETEATVDNKLDEPEEIWPLYELSGGHQSAVYSVDYSADGKRLLAASNDGRVGLWDLEKKKDPTIFLGTAAKASAVRWGPDEKRMFMADTKAGRVFSLETKKQEYAFEGHTGRVFEMQLQPQGTLVATGGMDGFVRLWEPGKGEIRALEHGKPAVSALAWTPDGRQVASGGLDGRVVVWDAETGEKVFTIEGNGKPINEIVVDPNGGNLYMASDDKSVRRWDLLTQRQIAQYDHHTDEVWALAISSDGSLLASAGKDDTVVWFSPSGNTPIRRQHAHLGAVLGLQFSPDDTALAVAGANRIIRVWGAPGKFWKPKLPPAGVVRSPPPLPDDLPPLELKVAKARRLITDGWEYRERLVDAEALLAEVLAVDSKHAGAHVQLARIARTRGFLRGDEYRPESLVRADQLLNQALTQDPGLVEAHYFRVQLLEVQNKDVAAIVAAAEKVVQLDHGSVRAKLVRAEIGLNREYRLDLALEVTRKILEDPDTDWRYAGWSLYLKAARGAREWAAAELGYIALIQLEPESAWARGNYARFLLTQLDDPDRAVDMARSALAIHDYPIGRLTLTEALTRQEEKKKEVARAAAAKAP